MAEEHSPHAGHTATTAGPSVPAPPRLGALRPGDARILLPGFALLLIIVAAHALFETARDALFLAQLKATDLPWAYLGMAVLSYALMRLLDVPRLRAVDRRLVLSVALGLSALCGLLFAWLLQGGRPWALYALYIFSGTVTTALVTQCWLLLADQVTVDRAKRLYALITAGGVLGATCGSLLADRTVGVWGPRALLLEGAVLLCGAAVLPWAWAGRQMPPAAPLVAASAPEGWREHCHTLRADPYVTRLFALVVLSALSVTCADYLTKSLIAAAVPAVELGAFFARFYLVVNALALVVQLMLASRVIRSLGVDRTLLILPAMVVVGALGVWASGALLAVLVMKGAEGSLRHSLHRTATEVLYVPLAERTRRQFKALAESLGQKGGQTLASLFLLVVAPLAAGMSIVIAATLVAAAAWLFVSLQIRVHYLQLFRRNLRQGKVQTEARLLDLDLHSLERLLAALNSPEESDVLTALELFQGHNRSHLVPPLLLHHPSAEVVMRVMALFAETGRRDALPWLRTKLTGGDDDAMRMAALRSVWRLAPEDAVLTRFDDDARPEVEATMRVGRFVHEQGTASQREHGRRRLDALAREGPLAAQRALAHMLQQYGDARLAWLVPILAAHPDIAVQRAVCGTVGRLADAALVPLLWPMLRRGEVRRQVCDAIRRCGTAALPGLDAALGERSLALSIRRHLPRILSRFADPEAAQILMRHLLAADDGHIRYKILRALGRMRADRPQLRLPEAPLRTLAERELGRAVQLLQWQGELAQGQHEVAARATEVGKLLVDALQEKRIHALERLFRIFGLLPLGEDMKLLWDGVRAQDPRRRAQSRELLAHAVHGTMGAAVLALLDPELEAALQVQHAAHLLGLSLSAESYQNRLAMLMRDGSEALSCIAAYHIGELGYAELEPQMRQAQPAQAGWAHDAMEHALSLLHQAPTTLLRSS